MPEYRHQEELEIHHLEGLTNPSTLIAFIGATFGVLNFAAAELPVTTSSIFTIGLIKMLLGSIYFIAALINLMKGNISGNINLIFAVCFGLFSGSNTFINLISGDLQIEFQPSVYGWLQIAGAVYIGLVWPVMRRVPMYQWIAYILSDIGLFLFGVRDVTGNQLWFFIGGWFFLAYTFLSCYMGLSAILPGLPQGKLRK